MSQRVDTPYLDAFAASFLVLGRLHLGHATEDTRRDIYSQLSDWPFWSEPSPLPELADLQTDAHTAHTRGTDLLQRSWESHEDDDTIRMDQDFLYGVSASARVSPFESVHVGEEQLVFDTETIQVRRYYARLGLQVPRLHTEPDDHLGLEFAFLSQGCQQMMTALEQGRTEDYTRVRDIVTAFTAEHPLRWVPATLREAEAQAQTAWMQGVEALSYATFASWCVTLSTRELPASADVVSGFAAPYRGVMPGHKGVAAGKFGDPGVPGVARDAVDTAAPARHGEPSEPGNPDDHTTENPAR
ncbi:molecular chaperone [uncultured Mobiluncus sp.]|uniref:TorD/DmsD family molecular chaperone n=1 Tax=uncultured Mobiluncus sp. TaxID=293425 RepID=UPI002633119A|nr:molecular chaperone TorD family protein [uncultured Mobiluncus sp.]